MVARVCFVDCETTGLDADRHEVYEIGLIVRQPSGGPDHEYRWWLRVDLDRADPTALRIGRYFERHPDQWSLRLTRQWWPDSDTGVLVETGSSLSPQPVSIEDAAESLMRLTAGAHLVGAVPSFDDGFLSKLLRANNCCPGWHYHLVDVEALIAGKLGIPPPWDSNELSRKVGVDPDQFDRHTALGDARWAKAIYDAIMGGDKP